MAQLMSAGYDLTITKWRGLRFFCATLAVCASSLAMAGDGVSIPNFHDPQHRFDRPETSSIRVIRFVTEDDYPPFGFTLPDGTLSGFNVDLARALCEELRVQCTVQSRRWDTMIEAIEQGRADAAVASIAITRANRARVDFTAPYYKTPARFVARASVTLADPAPETLAGKTVGVVARSAHEAYLRAFFPGVGLRAYDNALALRSALKRNEVEIAFGDGVAFALWLNGTDAAGCCAFRGGPYTESRFFGEGVGIALRKDNQGVKRALDYALKRVSERGVYADLYLKYFPIGFY